LFRGISPIRNHAFGIMYAGRRALNSTSTFEAICVRTGFGTSHGTGRPCLSFPSINTTRTGADLPSQGHMTSAAPD
jgi:hypothetical protein